MGVFTPFLQLFKPEALTDFMTVGTDLDTPYDRIDAWAQKVGQPIRGSMSSTSSLTRVTGTLFQVPFDISDYNHGGIVDLANDQFQIPVDDFWRITAAVHWSNGVIGTPRKALLVVNGQNVASSVVDDPSNNQDGGAVNNISWEADLSAGSIIQLFARHDNGSALTPAFSTAFGGVYMKISRGGFDN